MNGFQMMYADSYMTREEFRLMFDHTLYDKVSLVPMCGLLTWNVKLLITIHLLRYETSLAAEVTSQRSMTKSTRRLGQVGRFTIMLYIFFLFIHQNREQFSLK